MGHPLPPYAFLPGYRPHPRRDPAGHSFGESEPTIALPLTGDHAVLGHAERLFDSGYYWEAHEAWEAAWHALGRAGPEAEVMRGLIKLCALALKVRQGRTARVPTQANAALGHFERCAVDHVAGYDVRQLRAAARQVAATADTLRGEPAPAVQIVYRWRLAAARSGC